MNDEAFKPLDPVKAQPAKAAKVEWIAILPVPADAPKAPDRHPRLGKPAQRWTYRDARGDVLGHVCRFNLAGGDKQFRPLVLFRPAQGGAAQWRWESWPAPRPLYGLDELAATPSAHVLITEGEKAADAARKLAKGHVVITSPNGSRSAGKADWTPLKGRHVTIWPDADKPGHDYAHALADAAMQAGAASVAIIDPPKGVPDGWDAADALADGWTEDRAADQIRTATPHASASADAGTAKGKEGRQRRPAQRDSLMSLTTDCRLWHSPDGDGFASYAVGNHRENWPIRSQRFKRWLAARAYEHMGLAPGAQALEDTLRVLEARATDEGRQHQPWGRTGERDGAIFIDLGDADWNVVEITGKGWHVMAAPDVPFVRSPSMRPLPRPECGESIDRLRNFANVADEASFMMAGAWLVAALRPRGPYPILIANGEQGSGKSNFSRLLRSLVDPNAAPIRATPKDERDLIVAALNSHVLAFDNLSKVEPWLADALCRLSTGGGFSARALHTDRDEMVFSGTRPIILNGIPALSDRPDLADRAINIRLKSIPENERRPEDELWADWNDEAPMVLGALFDGVSAGLRNMPNTRLARSPRMADFAKWVTACQTGLAWEPGAFLQTYMDNRDNVQDTAFEADPIAVAIGKLAELSGPDGWRGTPTQLLEELSLHASDGVRRSRSWPQTPQGLGNKLDRIAPLLRSRHIHLERHHSGIRYITIVQVHPQG
jgi:hypothetical protein